MLRFDRHVIFTIALAVAATIVPAKLTNAELMYATDSGSDSLYLLDIESGAVTPIGPAGMGIGASTPVSLAVNPLNGRIFVGNNSPETVAGLLEVDRHNGMATHIGGSVREIAFDSQGILYTQLGGGGSTAPAPLGIVDIATGQATSLGGPDLPRLLGLAFSSQDGHLYGITQSFEDPAPELLKISTNGALLWLVTMSHSTTFPGALAFDSQGNLIGSDIAGQLFDIDPLTGIMSNFRSVPSGPQGLGRVIPEPAAIPLALFGLISLGYSHRIWSCVGRSGTRLGSRILLLILASFVFAIPASRCGALEIFSAGMEVPETISRIPAGFGAFEGDFLVSDARFGGEGPYPIWVVPAEGGAPTEFASFPNDEGAEGLRGGQFLPEDFGAVGGRYVTSFIDRRVITPGDPLLFERRSRIVTIDGTGAIDDFVVFEYQGPLSEDPFPFYTGLTTPVIAPQGFGSLGGQLIFTDQTSGVFSVDHNGNVGPLLFDATDFTFPGAVRDIPRVQPFGAVFAPEGFGSVGGTLLINDTISYPVETTGNPVTELLEILSIRPNGDFEIFTTIPVTAAQLETGVGLRQMAFVPDDFGDLSGLLLVSVSGSYQGGGTLGAVYALNDTGSIVKALRVGTEFDKFDPRGFYFTDDGRILISDASDPILVATVDDFFVIPEPSTLVLALVFITGSAAGCARTCRHRSLRQE